jgi:hypothetical protein
MSVHAAGCLLRTPPGSARQPRSDAAVAQARRCIAAEIERLCHRAHHRPGSEGVRRRVAQLRGLLARTASPRPRRRGTRQGAAAAAAAAARPTAAAAVQRRADALHRGVPVRLRSPNTAAAAVALALTPLCPPSIRRRTSQISAQPPRRQPPTRIWLLLWLLALALSAPQGPWWTGARAPGAVSWRSGGPSSRALPAASFRRRRHTQRSARTATTMAATASHSKA